MHKLVRIFKKISLFDKFIIITISILGLGFFLFFYRKVEYVTIRVKVTDQDVLYASTSPASWYANRFEIGDVEIDTLGRKITEITGIEKFNVTSNNKALYLDLRIRATYDTKTKLYSARGKTLTFGIPLRFTFSKVTFDGIVTEFPGSEYQKNIKLIYANVVTLGRLIEPALATAIKKGDKIYDSNTNLLAEVVDIQVKPAERVTQTDAGELLLRYDPLYKDIIITAKVRIKIFQKENFMFDNLPLKIGEIIPLNFDKISLFPIITDFSF